MRPPVPFGENWPNTGIERLSPYPDQTEPLKETFKVKTETRTNPP